MTRYVARARSQDRDDPTTATVQLRDGEEGPVSRASGAESYEETRAAVDRAFDELELRPESENLKKKAAPPPPGTQPPAEALRHTVAFHFTFSVPIRKASDLTAFEQAVDWAVEENFTREGYKCLWAVHGEDVKGEGEGRHGHAHAHMVVKAESDEPGGQRLRFGGGGQGRDVRDFRENFAARARDVGLTAASTWREDRAEVREAVAEGREVLRPHRDYGRARSKLAERAPDWALAYEPAAVSRRRLAARRRQTGADPWPTEPPPPEGLQRLTPRRREAAEASGTGPGASRSAPGRALRGSWRGGVDVA